MVDAYRKKKHGGIEKKRQSGSIWLDSICNWTVPHLRFSFEGHLERNPEYEDIEGEETVKFRKSDGIFLLENFHIFFWNFRFMFFEFQARRTQGYLFVCFFFMIFHEFSRLSNSLTSDAISCAWEKSSLCRCSASSPSTWLSADNELQ